MLIFIIQCIHQWDEDPERLTRWLRHTDPPLPENAPPLLGALTPGRFLRLLNRLSAERDVTQWVYDGDDLLTPEQVVITAMAGATDGWIYLIGPQYHYTHFALIPTSVPELIPDDQVDAYVDDSPHADAILDCTVGPPEQRRGNLASLAPWPREPEEAALKPLWEPLFTYSRDDQVSLVRLYTEVRTGDQRLLANILGERGLAAARAGERRHALYLLDQASGVAELAGDTEAAEAWAGQRDLVLGDELPGADKG